MSNKPTKIEDILISHYGPEADFGMWRCGGCKAAYIPVPQEPNKDGPHFVAEVNRWQEAAKEAITLHAQHQTAALMRAGIEQLAEDPRDKLRRRMDRK